VPLIGSCPAWTGDIPQALIPQFKTLVGQVHQDILRFAARQLITSDELKQWHSQLFSAFVPLDYYAGNYRGVERTKPCLAMNVSVGPNPGLHYILVRSYLSGSLDSFCDQCSLLEIRWPHLTPPDRAILLATITANLVGSFILVHPFINGNGRVSRLLWRWTLMRFGVPPQCCTHPRPNPPYSQVMAAAMHGDYRPLAMYVLQHLAQHPPAQN